MDFMILHYLAYYENKIEIYRIFTEIYMLL